MEIREEGAYVMVAIDYFTRLGAVEVIENKSQQKQLGFYKS